MLSLSLSLSYTHTHIAHICTQKAQHEISEKGERDCARAGAPTIVETLTPRDTLARYIVALRTGTVAFFIASAASADIAALRKAPKSSPIAQGIVIEVKGNFMIVEGVVWGLVLSGLSVLLMCRGEGNKVPKRGRSLFIFEPPGVALSLR